jgi:2'-5' RNA ligase
MNIAEHYDTLYKESIQKIRSDNYQTDHLIDSSSDHRLGITLIIRPGIHVKNKIQTFLTDLKAIEPDQYYYPNSDIHVTALSLIACYTGFDVAQISIFDYVELIKKSITSFKSFEIEFRGITASPSCVMVQGFLNDETLNDIRTNLRINFQNSNLQQTIDSRYSIQTAHSTVVRLRKRLTKKDDFIKVLDNYRDYNFGASTIDTLELVYNDWYHRKESVKELYRFTI